MTEETTNGGVVMSKMAILIISILIGLVMAVSGWAFNYALGNVEKQIVVLSEKVDNLPIKIVELQGLDDLLMQRLEGLEKDVETLEEDVKELKK